MKRIADLFYQNASKYAEKEAIWCDGKSLNYGALANLVSKYSNLLINNGVKYGEHIGIPMNNSIESVALMLTAADLGVGLVPINPNLPNSAIKIAFKSSRVKHIIARSAFYKQIAKDQSITVEGVKFCMDTDYDGTVSLVLADNMSNERPDTKEVDGNEVYIITMTSGSTGTPKPIILSQNNKFLRAMRHISMYHLIENDRILASTPLYHSLAERLVLMPLLLGATSILLPRFTPKLWMECVEQQKVTFSIAVSSQLSQIVPLFSDIDKEQFTSLRCIVSSSALLDSTVKEKLLEKLRCEFHEMYGTSETSTVTNIHFKEASEKTLSVGRTIEGADVHILTENGTVAEIGEVGEIACKTDLLCEGYYGKNDIFEEAKQDGYFKTGDLGYVDEDGYLYYEGRKKELIITGGVNVYPIDVENCVNEIEEVDECAAFAYPDAKLGEVVAVAVVCKNNVSIKKRTIQFACARKLADFQQPHEIFFVEELPKNAMGKLVKTDLVNYVNQCAIKE